MNGGPIGETRGKNKQHNDSKSNTNKQTKEKASKVHIKSAYESSAPTDPSHPGWHAKLTPTCSIQFVSTHLSLDGEKHCAVQVS